MASPDMLFDAAPGPQSNTAASPNTPYGTAAPAAAFEAASETQSRMAGPSHAPFGTAAPEEGALAGGWKRGQIAHKAGVAHSLERDVPAAGAPAGAAAYPSPLTLAAQAQASPNSVLQSARSKVRARCGRRAGGGGGPAGASTLSKLHAQKCAQPLTIDIKFPKSGFRDSLSGSPLSVLHPEYALCQLPCTWTSETPF